MSRGECPTWSEAKHVLCVRLDNLGDVLMTSPAMRALKAAAPGRRLTLLGSPSAAAVAPLLPEIDRTLVYDAPWVKNSSITGPDDDHAMIRQLATARFDAAVIFTVYSQSALPAALLCRLAGIPLILGHARENPYRLLSHWVRDHGSYDGGRHEVQRQLDLVATVGAVAPDTRMRVQVPANAHHRVQQLLDEHSINSSAGWIVVHPGASAASRRYPATRFGAAMRLLNSTLPILVTGGPQEEHLSAQVCQGVDTAVNLANRLSLAELAALISRARLLISNNSGPVHLAAALGTPVVDLYALTNPQHTPWQVKNRVLFHDVPCRYCYRSVCPEGHHQCLLGVSPRDVAQAAQELLSETAASVASGSGTHGNTIPCLQPDNGASSQQRYDKARPTTVSPQTEDQ